MSELSSTQHILIRLESKVDTIKEVIDRNESAIQSIPLIKYQQDQNHKAIEDHTQRFEKVNGDLNKAKGFGAALGFVSGFIGSLFGKH